MKRKSVPEKLLNYSRQAPTGCIEWTRQRDKDGYGIVRVGLKTCKAHRVAYELLIDEIPCGMQLDHLCRNTACINPAHLEPVKSRENTLRGVGPSAKNAAKLKCLHGHDLTPDNTYRPPNVNQRHCRICRRNRDIARKLRLKQTSLNLTNSNY